MKYENINYIFLEYPYISLTRICELYKKSKEEILKELKILLESGLILKESFIICPNCQATLGKIKILKEKNPDRFIECDYCEEIVAIVKPNAEVFFFSKNDSVLKIKNSDSISIYLTELSKCLNFFKNFLENHGIKTLKRFLRVVDEPTLQFILQSILFSHFWAYDEVKTGDGRIDFFLIGPENRRIIIETKLSIDEDYIEGLKQQLVNYLKREHAFFGYFILFYFDGCKSSISEVEKEIQNELSKINLEYSIRFLLIDLIERDTPSNIKSYQALRNLPKIGKSRTESLVAKKIFTLIDFIGYPTDKLCEILNLSKKNILQIKSHAENVIKKL